MSDANLILITGALVALADGRYAFTGPILGVGPASACRTMLGAGWRTRAPIPSESGGVR